MFQPNTILTLGIWLVLLYFLGIPVKWKLFLYVFTGVLLIVFYLLNAGRVSLRKFLAARNNADTFSQNNPHSDITRTPKI